MQLMFLSIALFSSSLLAQQHRGTRNQYKIGTSDSPVLAPEYKDFLNDKSSSDKSWTGSIYYDGSFMKASNNWGWLNDANPAIYRTGTRGSYLYSVIPDHENDIIDAVSLQSIQQKFNAWRAEKEAAEATKAAAEAAAAAEIAKNNPPAPENSDTPAPENSDTSAPDSSGTSVPDSSDTSATETIVTQN